MGRIYGVCTQWAQMHLQASGVRHWSEVSISPAFAPHTKITQVHRSTHLSVFSITWLAISLPSPCHVSLCNKTSTTASDTKQHSKEGLLGPSPAISDLLEGLSSPFLLCALGLQLWNLCLTTCKTRPLVYEHTAEGPHS